MEGLFWYGMSGLLVRSEWTILVGYSRDLALCGLNGLLLLYSLAPLLLFLLLRLMMIPQDDEYTISRHTNFLHSGLELQWQVYALGSSVFSPSSVFSLHSPSSPSTSTSSSSHPVSPFPSTHPISPGKTLKLPLRATSHPYPPHPFFSFCFPLSLPLDPALLSLSHSRPQSTRHRFMRSGHAAGSKLCRRACAQGV